eukprot:m.310942 g.310942  ORF g.310942 m.310942 type:complete len:343 (+) comp56898_c0_seq1:46-1074(+)
MGGRFSLEEVLKATDAAADKASKRTREDMQAIFTKREDQFSKASKEQIETATREKEEVEDELRKIKIDREITQEILDERRARLIKSFNSQRILLLGEVGHGKSSLINSFNYVANLVNSEAQFVTVAQPGGGHSSKTKRLTAYGPDLKEMYTELKDSGASSKAPTFLDTCGMPNRDNLTPVFQRLIDGQIEANSFIHEAVDKLDDAGTTMAALEKMKGSEKKPGCVVFVLSGTADGIGEGGDLFPDKMITGLVAALNELEKENKGVRLFVVVSKMDKVLSKERKASWKIVTNLLMRSCNISMDAIFDVSNFVQGDDDNFIERAKQLAIMKAFTEILAPWNQRR